MPEPSRRPEGRQWWRYDEGDQGDRPQDWAEMERAALKIAEECYNSETPYDGVLGFSQGAEMVHTLAVLKHRDDPRFSSRAAPKFGISLSGAVNPGHFESVGGGGPPRGLEGPRRPWRCMLILLALSIGRPTSCPSSPHPMPRWFGGFCSASLLVAEYGAHSISRQ
mmetsp:Transcript_23985/g.35854  ORF Transcript_23985/g.35854 Transcript_23985/m.35854 type:complete len:166 (+) Transcript_23985:3-500(+)